MISRRRVLAAPFASLALGACDFQDEKTPDNAHIIGGYSHESVQSGHFLRDAKVNLATNLTPIKTIRTACIIAGGGVAGLSAARALRLAGRDDFIVLELADEAGGNARGANLQGLSHPLGAHYLPAPNDDAPAVQALLEELGIRRRVAGRWVYDEATLCHSPQERLFFRGAWQEGLLPMHDIGAATLAEYQKFSLLIEQWQATGAFKIPIRNPSLNQHQQTAVLALHGLTFAAYLAAQNLNDTYLLWYLDYCCRDDYGAGMATVSAWAGIHYFAARHGFNAPSFSNSNNARSLGLGLETDKSMVLTWAQGNGFLTQALAAPLGERLHTKRIVLRVETSRSGVILDAYNAATQQIERYEAPQAVLALPAFITARVLVNPSAALLKRANAVQYSAWSVANILCDAPLRVDATTAGTAPEMAWDNVIYDVSKHQQTKAASSLGYVNAAHQTAGQVPAPTVLTHYSAYGTSLLARQGLLNRSWVQARDAVLQELATVHGDIYQRVQQINITRYGHAMAVPVPHPTNIETILTQPAMPRLAFAHSDWAGYSVFEEAFEQGLQAVHSLML